MGLDDSVFEALVARGEHHDVTELYRMLIEYYAPLADRPEKLRRHFACLSPDVEGADRPGCHATLRVVRTMFDPDIVGPVIAGIIPPPLP